ncbi:hypothetical protein JKF63_04798 [Porcisia hertigi]|uniref:Uncharacterized protein n=1 Tax=Porcisia hertigi TaxID=2761500 RepID=A0A836LA71_9TRYP|nr:hypothetical protein JKF63_04798 [Porcisia hertigi]
MPKRNDAVCKSRSGKRAYYSHQGANPGASGTPKYSGDNRTTSRSDEESHDASPNERVLTTALFMWERVAAFSVPSQVAEIERVSRDVWQHLKKSNTGTNLMQRYWNAQWSRLIWKDEELPEEKRHLLPTMLTRNDGKREWKKMFVEEYPLYLERLYRGVGVCNNALNEAKVFFPRQLLSHQLSEAEKKQLELTSRKPTLQNNERGRPRAVEKAPDKPYTRSDYKQDYRAGDRKGKHKKGGNGRWSGFDDFGDYDY